MLHKSINLEIVKAHINIYTLYTLYIWKLCSWHCSFIKLYILNKIYFYWLFILFIFIFVNKNLKNI